MNDFFSKEEPIISATAPGRMDVMGGIADYNRVGFLVGTLLREKLE